MALNRLQANLLYLVTLSLLAYIFYTASQDEAYPTGEFKTAVVQSMVPKRSRLSLKVLMTLRTEDGIETVRVVDADSGFKVGQKVKLQEYQSKRRGIKKYILVH